MAYASTLINTELAAGDANTVYAALMKTLDKYHVPLDKVVGICSDGASTMLGIHKGVGIQLAQSIRNARQHVLEDIMTRDCSRRLDSFHKDRGVFVVHCVCHRLALVLTDGIKGSTKCDAVIPDECVALMNA